MMDGLGVDDLDEGDGAGFGRDTEVGVQFAGAGLSGLSVEPNEAELAGVDGGAGGESPAGEDGVGVREIEPVECETVEPEL